MLNPVTGIGRAAWAAYLINGDDSGLEESERLEADSFVAWLGGLPVDCSAESFFARPDGLPGALPGDCLEYTALVQPSA